MNSSPRTTYNDLHKKSWLEKAFPVPHSLILSDVAVDTSDGTFRYFEFARNRGRLFPKSFGSMPFPRLNFGNPSDKVRSDAVAAIKSWASEKKHHAVKALVHEDEVYVFKARVPTAKSSEIPAAIEAALEENVPIPPNQAVFEYDVISVDEKLQETVVAVSVISKDTVFEYVNFFDSSGLTLVSLDTEARALARALFPLDEKKVHAVLYVAGHHSLVFVVENGAVVFSSSVEVGTKDLLQSITKTFGISDEDARKMKEDKAFAESDGDMKLLEAMIPIFSSIRDELNKVLVYWKAQGKKERDFKDIEDVTLVGGDTMIAGFTRYVSVTSKLPTKIGSVWTNVLSVDEAVPNLSRKESLDYGTVIGTLI